MREIKFRAWDKKKKQIIYDYDQDIEKKGYSIKFGESIHLIVYTIGLIYNTLMQFTGIKDKNGKEIYEGDIVKCVTQKVITQYKFKAEIIFKDGSFYLWYPNDKVTKLPGNPIGIGSSLAHHNSSELKVIGNIYENPELIK